MLRLLQPEVIEDLRGRFRLIFSREVDAQVFRYILSGADEQDLRPRVVEKVRRV
jgi:hypothetical protein